MSADGRREALLALIAQVSADGRGVPDSSARLSEIGLDSLAHTELVLAVDRELGVDLSGLEAGADTRVDDLLLMASDGGPAPHDLPPAASDGSRPAGRARRRPGRLQGVADAAGGWALRWWLAMSVSGADRIPKRGPVILAMNHESALDIPVIVTACPRRITFMAKRELFKNAFVSRSLHELGGFPVDRLRYDVHAVAAASEALRGGRVLGMYPEGTRLPGRLGPFLPGAAWLALRTGAPIVPCSIRGTHRAREALAPGRVRVEVHFHPPIEVEPVEEPHRRRARADELTARLREEIGAALGRLPSA